MFTLKKLLRNFTKRSHQKLSLSRKLNCEHLEPRRVLAAMLDLVFLVDETGSEENTHDWLRNELIPQLEDSGFTNSLVNKQITDVRYGLVGFGDSFGPGSSGQEANSFIIDSTGADQLFGSLADVQSAAENLRSANQSDGEDGWDAIEHAIAEYDFWPGAVPVLVLVQNQEGRNPLFESNDTLTRKGIFAAMESKNILFNTLIVGTEDNGGTPPPVFDLDSYKVNAGDFLDQRIIGVEADATDGSVDRQHDFHLIQEVTGATVTNKPATQSDALQVSFNGSNTGNTGMVGTGKSVLIDQSLAGGIGPTAFGYRAQSMPFAFEDISDDAGVNSFIGGNFKELSSQDLDGFAFPFYGTTFDGTTASKKIFFNAHGAISFGNFISVNSDIVDLSRVTAKSRPTMPMIAPLWNSMSRGPLSSSKIYWKVEDVVGAAGKRLIIQWHDYRYNGTSDGDITFQARLYDDGRIQLNYEDLDADGRILVTIGDNDFRLNGGIKATVGIWSGAPDVIDIPGGKYVPGPHDLFGSTTGTGTDTPLAGNVGETNDSYIRMAWDTGGAAWDLGVVEEFGITSPEANTLRDEFVDSLGDQILRAKAAGDVFHPDNVLLALNVGGTADLEAGTAGTFRADDGTFTDTSAAEVDSYFVDSVVMPDVDLNSNSIPTDESNPLFATAMEDVFRSSRGQNPQGPFTDVSFSIDKLDDGTGNPIPFADGSYIVELFFAENRLDISSGANTEFPVLLEGQTLLDDYAIFSDKARIVDFSANELKVADTGGDPNNEHFEEEPAGVVRRFKIDVTGGDGLQIDLVSISSFDPILSGVRILSVPSADFDVDSDVDGTDFLAWQRGFGTVAPNATKEDGDADNDTDVDSDDLAIWEMQFGLSGGKAAASSSAQSGGSGPSFASGGSSVTTVGETVTVGSGTGETSSLTSNAQLLYDPSTGNVQIDANGNSLLSFSLVSDDAFSAVADFSDLDYDVLPGLASGVTDNTTSNIGWVSVLVTAGYGFDGPALADVGAIFPTGLNEQGLAALLTDATFIAGYGVSGQFDLVVTGSAQSQSARSGAFSSRTTDENLLYVNAEAIAAQFAVAGRLGDATLLQAQISLIQSLFRGGFVPDITGDGLIDRDDYWALVEPLIVRILDIDSLSGTADSSFQLEHSTSLDIDNETSTVDDGRISAMIVDEVIDLLWGEALLSG